MANGREAPNGGSFEMDPMLHRSPLEINYLDDDLPLTEDTTCGFWFVRSSCLQMFASKKAYVLVFGLLSCGYNSLGAYFNGTITSMEKRFKYPSWTSGIIASAIDICGFFCVLITSYYGGKGHKPRWIAFGNIWMVLSCLIMLLPHVLYGSGKDSLDLTEEYGTGTDRSGEYAQNRDTLCQTGGERQCEEESGSLGPAIILFLGQFVSGIGASMSDALGLSYMDDNIEKTKTPFLISVTYFIKLLGPAVGFSMASYSLRFYISSSLTPTITEDDPRWIGAWWLGWIVFAVALTVLGFLLAMFPRELPRAAARRKKLTGIRGEKEKKPASIRDMKEMVGRLVKNKPYMCNNFATVFFFLGNMPYQMFMSKYIEILYQKSAALSNFYTGTVAIVFASIGIVTSGALIAKFQPRARTLAAWSLFTGAVIMIGMLSYTFLGCEVPQLGTTNLNTGELNMTAPCNAHCNCDYVSYSPVCSSLNTPFITPCHAGCTDAITEDGQETFTSCKCLLEDSRLGTTVSGYCSWNCDTMFYAFLVIACILTFMGSSARAAEFLVGIRCVDEDDKSVSMGLSLMMISAFAWVPAATFYGWIFDTTCQVWGKTCTGTGNCWLYDSETLRYRLNLTTAFFGAISILFDGAVWYYVKDVEIFDS